MKDSLFPDLPPATEPSAAPSRKWLIYLAVAAACLTLVLLPLILGPSSQNAEDEQITIDPEELRKRDEAQLLKEVVEMIQPARLGNDVNETFVSEELNRWLLEYGDEADLDEADDSLQELLGADAADLALAPEFSQRDVAHLASALTLRQAGLAVTTGLTGDREKVTAAFYFVVRNIEVMVDPSSAPAVFPYQALLWGRGRSEDRIWIFAELLRQIRVHSYVVVPAEGEAVQPLVAVSTDEGVLLFDPTFGLPIPSLAAESDDAVLPQVAATYAEALENDAVFRQFDAEEAPYPWTAEALRNVRLLVIGSDSTFSPRMEALQQSLPSEFSFLVFDGLAASGERESAHQQRAQDLSDQLPDVAMDLGAWMYPLTQAASYEVAGSLESHSLMQRLVPFRGPTVVETVTEEDGSVTKVDKPAAYTLQMARAEQIQGNFNEAMRRYLPMRNAYRLLERSENGPVSEMSGFWATLCQFEIGRPDLAINGFQQYLRDYENGQFAQSAGYWLAVSEAMNSEAMNIEPQTAIAKLQSLTTLPPGQLKYLTDRWSRLPASDETESDASVSQASAVEDDEP